jgi:cupin 2 domain-containing protein
VNIRNLFENAAPPVTGERFETLLKHKNLVIEWICSSADIPMTQYVQTQDEWVLLIQGTAEIGYSDFSVDLLKLHLQFARGHLR